MAKRLKFNEDKIKSLTVGQKFSTYRELCDFLDSDFAKGNTRIAQFKEWERYVKFKTNKNGSLTVTEIYENQIEKVDNRRNGNNTVYKDLVKLILLNYLRDNIDDELGYVCITNSTLYGLLGFVNDNYLIEFIRKYKIDTQHKNNVKELKEEFNITPFDMNNFYEHSRLKFNSIINRAIEDLEESFVLLTNPAFVITEFVETEYNMKLKNDILEKLQTESVSEIQLYNMLNKFELTTTKVAEGDEVAEILNVTRDALNIFDLDGLIDAYKKGESNNLFREITLKLLTNRNWIFCYKTRKFICSEFTIDSGIKIFEKGVEKQKSRVKKLNSLIKDAVNQSAVSAYNNNLKKQEQIESDALNNIMTDDRVFRFKDNYIEVRQALVEYFMSLEKDEKN